MKRIRIGFLSVLLSLTPLFTGQALAQSGPPPLPVIPPIIGWWGFNDTNFLSAWADYGPASFTNVESVDAVGAQAGVGVTVNGAEVDLAALGFSRANYDHS